LHIDHLDYFGQSFPHRFVAHAGDVLGALNCLDRPVQPPPLFLDRLSLPAQRSYQVNRLPVENLSDFV
jgi:hypothetical protein